MNKTLFFSILLIIIIITPVQAVAKEELSFSQDWLDGVVIVVYGNQYGTAFWINPTHVVTAAHVVSNNRGASVQIIRGSVVSTGHVVALDSRGDVAVIRVDNADSYRKHIFALARSPPGPTSTIYVIGYPSELLQVTGDLRELSNNPRVLESRLTWHANGLIELGGITDAGNSGGPVVDYYGNVIGVVSFALRGQAGTLYFATSAANLRSLLLNNNIAFTESNSGLLPESFAQNPVAVGVGIGVTTSILTVFLLGSLGLGIGLGVLSRRKKR